MIDIAVLEAMVAEGATAATIVRVVKMMVERENIRRQQWADSQARTRAKRAGKVVNYSTSQQTVNRHDLAYIEEKKVKKEKKVYMPADFVPNEADLNTCQKAGWDQAKIASELTRFRDHAAANARLQVDWHASFRNWVTSPLQTPPKPNGGTNGHHANPAAIRRTSDAVNETLARRQERFRFG